MEVAEWEMPSSNNLTSRRMGFGNYVTKSSIWIAKVWDSGLGVTLTVYEYWLLH